MKKKGHRPVILVHFRFSSKIAALNRAELMLTYVYIRYYYLLLLFEDAKKLFFRNP